jgi:hypothetical protein
MIPFTVVVPTRERCDTLRATLRSCIEQDYDALQIVVSDNASQDATTDVVHSFIDPRIRHVRTDRRVSMASNWEFGLSHVTDGFVLILGDDDALLPHCIVDLAEILTETRCQAMGWAQAIYAWPGVKGGKTPNRLKMSLRRDLQVRDARRALDEVIGYTRVYKDLPALYWGAVHTDVLARARPANGRLIQSVNPDVYTSLATTMLVDRYVHASGPFTVLGLSSHSTGISFMSGDTKTDSKVGTFWKEVDLAIHPDVAMVPAPPVYVTEAYAQARDHIPGISFPAPDYAKLFAAAMRELAPSASKAAYDQVRDAVLVMGERHHLQDAARAAIAAHPHHGGDHHESPAGLNVWRDTITIDCDAFRVRDAFGAAQLCYDTLKLYELGYMSPKGMAASLARRVVDRLGHALGRLRPGG